MNDVFETGIRRFARLVDSGAGRRTIVYIPKMEEPELMYKLFDAVVGTLDDLVSCLQAPT